jgi:hypothetical protein
MATIPAPQLNDDDLELLSAYIDRQLTDDARAALERRLEREPALRLALDELRATVAALRALEPARPPRSFTLDVSKHGARKRSGWGFGRLLPFGSGLAALLVAAWITASMFGGQASAPTFQTISGELAPGGSIAAANTAEPPRTFRVPAEPAAPPEAPAPSVADTQNSAPTATMAAPAAAAPAATAPAPISAPAPTTTPAPTSAPAAASEPTGAPAATAPAVAMAPAPEQADGGQESAAGSPADTTASDAVPIETPGSSSEETLQLDQQAPAGPAARASQTLPSTLLIGVPLVLLLVVLGVWAARRRR